MVTEIPAGTPFFWRYPTGFDAMIATKTAIKNWVTMSEAYIMPPNTITIAAK